MVHIENIIRNVLTTLYQSFGASIVFAVIVMFAFLNVKDIGIRGSAKKWFSEFKNSGQFRWFFYLSFYTAMILFRTLLCRSIWTNPVENVIGIWGLHNSDGTLSTEVIENYILFFPWTFLVLGYYMRKQEVRLTFYEIVRKSFNISLGFSVLIEIAQLMLKLGTFQLSDLFFNTIGGISGGILFYLLLRIKNRNQEK